MADRSSPENMSEDSLDGSNVPKNNKKDVLKCLRCKKTGGVKMLNK